jgi:Tol biopolymer transport system component
MILGTAAYMSPEQARGKPVDKRTDIWAFGAVLYELLTGEQLFQGEDLTDTLAAVVRKEPDWNRVPFEVRRLLKACLEKDPARRLRDIADVWRLLEEPPAETTRPAESRSKLAVVMGALAAAFAVAAAAIAFVHFRETPSVPAAVRFEIVAPEKTTLAAYPPVVSPDGKSVAFVARGDDEQVRIWIRAIDSLQPRMLRGTEGVTLPGPFWSPDSRFLGFLGAGALKKIDANGGPSASLADMSPLGGSGGGTWNDEGTILVGSPNGVFQVAQSGGAPELVTNTESPKETGHAFPHFLPDGRHFLYLSVVPRIVYLASLGSKVRTPLVKGVSRAEYVPPATRGRPGHLLYVRDATLMAQPLDSDRYTLAGEPFPVAEELGTAFGGNLAYFSTSPSGALAFRTGEFSSGLELTWFDRHGGRLGTVGPRGNYLDIALARRADQVAVAFGDGQSPNPDIWLMDAKQGVPTRFTTSAGVEIAPVWSPDDQKLAFSSDEGGILNGFVRDVASSSKGDPVLRRGRIRDWSSDGRYLLYDSRGTDSLFRFWIMPLEGEQKPITYELTRFNLAQGQFAPSGSAAPKWIAYVSSESGSNEIYVQSFPPAGRGMRVSSGGGTEPRWRADGKELFYIAPGGSVMAVDTTLAPTFSRGVPRELFKAPIATGGPRAFAFHYDVAPDGKRFLLITTPQADATAPPPITVVLNWHAALKK